MNGIKNGICYLLGAGPGDPGLLTIRARDYLARAQVVYYDYLASEQILAFAPAAATKVYVGKQAGKHAMPQEEINRLLVRDTAAGMIVVRLKGGDPYTFGRGGEEALALKEAGLCYEVVPGISAAVAAGAGVGIPLTHRGISTGVSFVTGHESPDKAHTQNNWSALAASGHTLCIYMGMGNLPNICRALLAGGRAESEPVAVIRNVSTPAQELVFGTLADISERVERAGIGSPAIVIVGEVVSLRGRLSEAERLPLSDKRVLVTRSREQAGQLSEQLSILGARAIECPCIEIERVEFSCSPEIISALRERRFYCGGGLDAVALKACDSLTRGVVSLACGVPDYVVFTSANGVEHTFSRMKDLELDARIFARVIIAAIGPATADALMAHGLRADIVPESFTSAALLENLEGRAIAGKRFLLLRADNAGSVLPNGLLVAGAEVDDHVAYRVSPAQLPDEMRARVLQDGFDAITFASSGTVSAFFQAMGAERINELLSLSRRPLMVSIGPVTSATMRALALPVDLEATEATIPGLVQALAVSFAAAP